MSFRFNPFTGNLDIIGSNAASGGVQGPSSSTDLAIAIYNGTTGQIIKNTNVTIDPYDFVYGSGFIQGNGIGSGVTVTVGTDQQLVVIGPYFITGMFFLEGQIIIL